MGRRLFRIYQQDIPKQITALAGVEVNVIMKSKITLHGTISEVKGNEVSFKDFRNQTMLIKVDEIAEIIYDKESAY